jgi:hypothetical protein
MCALKGLTARPIMQVRTKTRAVANPKTESDAREITTIINPALDMLRTVHALTQLAQICFGDMKIPEDGFDSSDEVVAGEVHLRPGYTPEEPAPFDAATGQPERPKR